MLQSRWQLRQETSHPIDVFLLQFLSQRFYKVKLKARICVFQCKDGCLTKAVWYLQTPSTKSQGVYFHIPFSGTKFIMNVILSIPRRLGISFSWYNTFFTYMYRRLVISTIIITNNVTYVRATSLNQKQWSAEKNVWRNLRNIWSCRSTRSQILHNLPAGNYPKKRSFCSTGTFLIFYMPGTQFLKASQKSCYACILAMK